MSSRAEFWSNAKACWALSGGCDGAHIRHGPHGEAITDPRDSGDPFSALGRLSQQLSQGRDLNGEIALLDGGALPGRLNEIGLGHHLTRAIQKSRQEKRGPIRRRSLPQPRSAPGWARTNISRSSALTRTTSPARPNPAPNISRGNSPDPRGGRDGARRSAANRALGRSAVLASVQLVSPRAGRML